MVEFWSLFGVCLQSLCQDKATAIPGDPILADVPGPGLLAYSSAKAEDTHQAAHRARFAGHVAIRGVPLNRCEYKAQNMLV